MSRDIQPVNTIRVKRPSPDELAMRLKFCVWRIKRDIRLKLWLLRYRLFEADLDKDKCDSSTEHEVDNDLIDQMDEEEEEYFASRPVVEPRRTVLIYSKDDELRCNFITTRKYENYITRLYYQALEWGMNTFVVDISSPFGLLVYEMLLVLRERGDTFKVYVFHSRPHALSKSFRLVPETDLERIFDRTKADYYYNSLFPKEKVIEGFTKYSGVVFTEKQVFVCRHNIPDHLLEAWGFSA